MIVAIYSQEPLARSLRNVLETCGMHVVSIDKVHQVPALIKRDRPDVLVCYRVAPQDIRLVRELLKPVTTSLPIFTVYSRASAIDRLNTLRSGIRRVYLEPFPITRLVHDIGALAYEVPDSEELRVGKFSLDSSSVSAHYAGQPLRLTKKQFSLLTLLLERPNRVVTKVQIWERVWGLEDYPRTNCVEALISRLRRVLPVGEKIEQVYGVGYRFRPTVFNSLSPLQAVVERQGMTDETAAVQSKTSQSGTVSLAARAG